MLSFLDDDLPTTPEGRRRAVAAILAAGYLRLRTCAGQACGDSSGGAISAPRGQKDLDDVEPGRLHGDQTVSNRENPEESPVCN